MKNQTHAYTEPIRKLGTSDDDIDGLCGEQQETPGGLKRSQKILPTLHVNNITKKVRIYFYLYE